MLAKRKPLRTRFNFRLNARKPKAKVVADFLGDLAENYEAAGAIKRALYERITGLDYDTGKPLLVGLVITVPEPRKRSEV